MADVGELRLTVYAPPHLSGEFRFSVLRRQYGQGSPFAVVDTGGKSALREAMEAAEGLAATLMPSDTNWLIC